MAKAFLQAIDVGGLVARDVVLAIDLSFLITREAEMVVLVTDASSPMTGDIVSGIVVGDLVIRDAVLATGSNILITEPSALVSLVVELLVLVIYLKNYMSY